MITNSRSIWLRSAVLIQQSALQVSEVSVSNLKRFAVRGCRHPLLPGAYRFPLHCTYNTSFRASVWEVTLEVCVSGQIWSFRWNKCIFRPTASAGAPAAVCRGIIRSVTSALTRCRSVDRKTCTCTHILWHTQCYMDSKYTDIHMQSITVV